jgi:predicted DNA-binding protein
MPKVKYAPQRPRGSAVRQPVFTSLAPRIRDRVAVLAHRAGVSESYWISSVIEKEIKRLEEQGV